MELSKKRIFDLLKEQVRLNPCAGALETQGFVCSWKELDDISDFLAVRMHNDCIVKGMHVGIWCCNSPKWVYTFLALIKLGAVPVLINTHYKPDELRAVLDYADVSVLYYGRGYREVLYGDVVSKIEKYLPKLKRYTDMNYNSKGKFLNCEDFSKSEKSAAAMEMLENIKKGVKYDDTVCIIFTSGTTSVPKGVMLSHYNIVNNSAATVRHMGWCSSDKMCITVPLFHCFGVTSGIVACMISGASAYLLPHFSTEEVWKLVTEGGYTILNGVPSMFLAMVRKGEHYKDKAVSLKSGIIAGSSIIKRDYFEIMNRFPDMKLQPSYGQTETSPCVSIADPDDCLSDKATSCGKVIEDVKVRIADTQVMSCNGRFKEGEIQVKGYNVMKGYYKLENETMHSFTEDGWLKTGDIGYFNEEGRLCVTGRIKDIIIRGGENISPGEIEELVRRFDCIKEAKVIGIPAGVVQEEPVMCLVVDKKSDLSDDTIKQYLSRKLADYKVPSHIIRFLRFPVKSNGKLDIVKLKSMVLNKLELNNLKEDVNNV